MNVKDLDKLREALTFYAEAWHKNYYPSALLNKAIKVLDKYHCVAVAHLSGLDDPSGKNKPVILKWTLVDLTNIHKWVESTKLENFFVIWPNYSEDILLEIPLTPFTNYN